MKTTLRAGTPLARLLQAMADKAEERLSAHLQDAPTAPDAAFRNAVAFALAVMRVSSNHAQDGTIDLRLVRDAARDAAAACRERGDGAELRSAALTFDDAVHVCTKAVG